MNKSELIDLVAQKTGHSKVATNQALDAIVEAITETVAKGDAVTLIGFGTFKTAARAARTGKNPKTGAALKIPATIAPKFTAGTSFKTLVKNKGKKK